MAGSMPVAASIPNHPVTSKPGLTVSAMVGRWRRMRPGLGTSHHARSFGARVHPGCDFAVGGLNSGKYLRYRFQRAIIGHLKGRKKMREAVIVSYARTGLAKSGR